MNVYRFEDRSGEVYVEYKVDSITKDFTNFTVYEVVGASDAEIRAGVDFRQLKYSLKDFQDFATDNNLRLSFVDFNAQTTEIIQDWDLDSSESISLVG